MIWYEEHIPCPELQPYIKLYYLLDVQGAEDATDIQRVTPDGCYELNFLIGTSLYRTNKNGEKVCLPDNHVVSRFRDVHFLAGAEHVNIFGVRFQPLGLQRLSNTSFCDATDEVIEPEYFFKNDYNYLKDAINVGVNLFDYIHYSEVYFKRLLGIGSFHEHTGVVTDIAENIIKCRGKLHLQELYDGYGISERRLQQLFTDSVGVTPKYYSRLMRYQNVLKDMRHGNYKNMTHLAYQNNYTDQSHFIHDFKSFSGLSPSKFVKERHMLNDMISATTFQ